MRVRVRPTGAGAHETVRVELRPDTALPELYAAVAEATGRPSNVLRLSLNKTVCACLTPGVASSAVSVRPCIESIGRVRTSALAR